MFAMLPLSMIGCFDLGEFVAGATEETFVAGTVLGLSASENMNLVGTRYEEGSRAAAYLGNLNGEAVDGAMGVLSDSNGSHPLESVGDGGWISGGLTYTPGEIYSLLRDGEVVLSAEAAPAVELDVEPTHTAGAPLTIDIRDQEFALLLVTVLDLEEGVELWDNVPDDLAHASESEEEDPLLVEIPGEAFPADARLALGVAGLRLNDPADAYDVNTLVSTLATGLLVLHSVETSD
jgi:hypothetical protein